MTEKITIIDIDLAGNYAIRRFKDVGVLNFYHNKLKTGERSFKWVMHGVTDERKAEQIVEAVKRKLVSMGLDVVKAFVASTESRSELSRFGVRIWIANI